MKKIISICVLALFISSFTYATKKVNISGKIVDQTTQSPLAYATVTVLNSATKEMVAGEATDESGVFKIKIPTGNFDIKIEYIAFKTILLQKVNITKNYDLKTVELVPDVNQLADIEVIGERSTIEYKLDKKVFNVGKDLMSNGGNVTDILDNVPSVSVDAGGTVSLRGNANVRILINGKPSVLSSNNGLESLPADLVAKVEVITNPSAKYEASGTAGIINVVLKKNKGGGLGGSIKLTTGFPANHHMNVNLNYKADKFNFFTNIGYRYSNFFGEGTQDQSILENGVTRILNQTVEQKRNDNLYNFYLGGDYYFNKKNTLTFTYYNHRLQNTDETDFNYTYSNSIGEIDSIFTQKEIYSEPQHFNQLEIDYIKTFDKKGKKFTASIIYDFWNDDENETLNQNHTMPFSEDITTIKTRDIESSTDLFVNADFETPLKNNAKFETGFRSEFRRISSEYSASINAEPLTGFGNLLNYHESILGAYIQYGQNVKKINYQLGLRSEYSIIDISDRQNNFDDLKKYINFFPTAHLTYRFTDQLNMQLSYSRRIQRPRFWQLNPFGGFSDTRNRFVGNPDLDPTYTDSYELGILKRWDKITFNPSVYFQNSKDFFQFVTRLDGNGNFLTFPVNLSHENRLGVELSASYSPAKWLHLSAEFNYYKFKQVGDFENQNFNTQDDNWSARINSRMKFKNGLSIQSTFRYYAQNQSGQTLVKAQKSLDLGVSKDLMGDKANLSFNFRNILDSRITQEIVTGENFLVELENKRIGRRISATFTYRFNRKKNERDRMHGR